MVTMWFMGCTNTPDLTHSEIDRELFKNYLAEIQICDNDLEKGILIIVNESVCASCQPTVLEFLKSYNHINGVIINSRFLQASPYLQRIREHTDAHGIDLYEDRNNYFCKNVYPNMPYPLVLTVRGQDLIRAYELTNANFESVSEGVLRDLTDE